MGYTHYYSVLDAHTAEWQAAWPKLIEEVPLIIEAADAHICGPTENGEDLAPPIANVDDGIAFNGVADDSHETFHLSREAQYYFVKTLQKPYDTAVACVLLRAHLLCPNNFKLSSDGSWDQIEWKKTRQLYQELWPGEPIRCPWRKDRSSTTNNYMAKSVTSSTVPNRNDVPVTASTPDATTEVAELCIKQQSDSMLSSEPKLVGSTVSRVDFSHTRRWLFQCERDANHSECKASKLLWQSFPGVRFRAIDVHKRCIVEAPINCSYIALSYVWGGEGQSKLTADSVLILTRERGLEAVWLQLPTTIQDAIIVCEKLEERYLWIDALCIMQDSLRDMKLQILRMRQIYAAAKCTIIAVSAETASVGLLGSSQAIKSPPCTSEDCLDKVLESSPWSSRAWCYQEKVLSHRAIFFTSSGIYMQCQRSILDVNGTPLIKRKENQNLARFNTIGGMLSIPSGAELESYISAVEYYSQRKLTKLEDKMNAFQGIFRRYQSKLDGKNNSFCYGLPISAFDQAICWKTRRHRPHLRNRAFPSWSWLGWDDAVSFDHKIIRTTRTNQMIYCTGIPYTQDDYTKLCELRKPALYDVIRGTMFGFPASQGGQYYNSPKILLLGSVSHLRIAPDPANSEGSNGFYAVFSTECLEEPPPPPKQPITMLECLSQPLPEIKSIDADKAAAPSVPAVQETVKDYSLSGHDNHGACAAKTPLAYIWLDNEWRKKQPEHCIMEFMALTGQKDTRREGQWVITMLMCLQRIVKGGIFWGTERLQVTNCEIPEERWLETKANVIFLQLI